MPPSRAAQLAWRFGVPIAAVLLGSCGQSTVVGPARELRVALGEYRMNPSRAHVGSGRLTVVATNFGRLTHDLVISLGGSSIVRMKPLAPGASERTTVQLGSGHYQMGSTLGSDQALGILGTLTVS